MWIVKSLSVTAILLSLSACATPPQWLANHYNSQDPCQNYYNVPNYQYPEWCGASNARMRLYDNRGRLVGTVR